MLSRESMFIVYDIDIVIMGNGVVRQQRMWIVVGAVLRCTVDEHFLALSLSGVETIIGEGFVLCVCVYVCSTL